MRIRINGFQSMSIIWGCLFHNYTMTTATTSPPGKRWLGHLNKPHWSWLEIKMPFERSDIANGCKRWHWLRRTAAGFGLWCLNYFLIYHVWLDCFMNEHLFRYLSDIKEICWKCCLVFLDLWSACLDFFG